MFVQKGHKLPEKKQADATLHFINHFAPAGGVGGGTVGAGGIVGNVFVVTPVAGEEMGGATGVAAGAGDGAVTGAVGVGALGDVAVGPDVAGAGVVDGAVVDGGFGGGGQ